MAIVNSNSAATRHLRDMPSTSKRKRLLHQVGNEQSALKRRRLQHLAKSLVADLSSSSDSHSSDGADTDADNDNTNADDASSSSHLSSVSDESSISSVSHASSSDSMSSSDLEGAYFARRKQDLDDLARIIQDSRVLDSRPKVSKTSQLYRLDDWRQHSPELFRKRLRVQPLVFDKLLHRIKDHSIFHNNSHCPQFPVHIQLAVFLFRLGHYGNSVAPEVTAEWAGVSIGSVVNFTNRCLIAVLSLHDEFVQFPDDVEKEKAKAYTATHTCPEWRNGWVLVDGTKFKLFQKPGMHGEAFFDKNRAYSLDCQVCNKTFTSLDLIIDDIHV